MRREPRELVRARSFPVFSARSLSVDTTETPSKRSIDVGSLTRLEMEPSQLARQLTKVNGITERSVAWRPHRASMGDIKIYPRLINRDSVFYQSQGKFNIRRRNDQEGSIKKLRDLFHTMINMSAWKTIAIAAIWIISSWFVLALFLMMISSRCGLKANTFLKALILSIETMETIGYGLPDPYLQSCISGVFVLGGSAMWGTLMNALIVAIVIARFSRPQGRAASVIFSNNAIIAEIGGQVYLMFQVCDMRKHQLVEAHIRLYCVQHSDTSNGISFQTRAMRLQHPDDDVGGMLLMALPQLIVHRIDPWSPLWPEALYSQEPSLDHDPQNGFCFPETVQRAADGENGNRDMGPPHRRAKPPTLLEVTQRAQLDKLEVIAIVEGIEPSTSTSLQARHSYTCDDFVFNASFQKCVSRGSDGMCVIDFNAFHELVDADAIINPTSLLVQSMA